jgi:hypothetical protein
VGSKNTPWRQEPQESITMSRYPDVSQNEYKPEIHLPQAPAIEGDVIAGATFMKNLPVLQTLQQLDKLTDQMIVHQKDEARLKAQGVAEKKVYDERATAQRVAARKLAKTLESKHADEPVQCVLVLDYRRGRVLVKRLDTGQQVPDSSRMMTADELQRQIPGTETSPASLVTPILAVLLSAAESWDGTDPDDPDVGPKPFPGVSAAKIRAALAEQGATCTKDDVRQALEHAIEQGVARPMPGKKWATHSRETLDSDTQLAVAKMRLVLRDALIDSGPLTVAKLHKLCTSRTREELQADLDAMRAEGTVTLTKTKWSAVVPMLKIAGEIVDLISAEGAQDVATLATQLNWPASAIEEILKSGETTFVASTDGRWALI